MELWWKLFGLCGKAMMEKLDGDIMNDYNEIIRKEYIKFRGEMPTSGAQSQRDWIKARADFTAGWNACEEWQAEQDAMSKDYQEEQQEYERLRRGQ